MLSRGYCPARYYRPVTTRIICGKYETVLHEVELLTKRGDSVAWIACTSALHQQQLVDVLKSATILKVLTGDDASGEVDSYDVTPPGG